MWRCPNIQYDNYSVLRIRRQGKPRISRNSDLDNQHEYDGAENDLVLKRVYTIEFLCEFSMQNYPFDVQKCDMLLKIRVGNQAVRNYPIRTFVHRDSTRS